MTREEVNTRLKAEIVKRSRKPEDQHDFSGPEWDKVSDIVYVIASEAYRLGREDYIKLES